MKNLVTINLNAFSLGIQDDKLLPYQPKQNTETTTIRPKNPYFPNENPDSIYDPWEDEEYTTQECKLNKYKNHRILFKLCLILILLMLRIQLIVDKKSIGWCLNDQKQDQNEGSRVLPGEFDSLQCLQTCQRIQKSAMSHGIRITGCEHNSYSHTCQYHTMTVSGGSGSKGYNCWIFNTGKHKIWNATRYSM